MLFARDHLADIHAGEDNALFWACRNAPLEVVEFLLQSGADVYARNRSLINTAIKRGDISLLELLAKYNVDLQGRTRYDFFTSQTNSSSLTDAGSSGRKEIVDWLLKKEIDIHTGSDAALMAAVNKCDFQMVSFLLNNGANIHARYDEAFHFAHINARRRRHPSSNNCFLTYDTLVDRIIH